jgi:hypothetical protein
VVLNGTHDNPADATNKGFSGEEGCDTFDLVFDVV